MICTPARLRIAGARDVLAAGYAAVVAAVPRRARVEDVHELAMPHVVAGHGPHGNPVYQVGGKSFVFFRNPRPDAVDPGTGERYADVIVFWVPSEADKQALVHGQASPFFTTSHFDGHPSVLVRGSRIGRAAMADRRGSGGLTAARARPAAAGCSCTGPGALSRGLPVPPTLLPSPPVPAAAGRRPRRAVDETLQLARHAGPAQIAGRRHLDMPLRGRST